MKYLLFYFVVSSSFVYGPTSFPCNPCSSSIGAEQGQWTALLKNSKAECMEELKKRPDATHAWCIPVNGYTNELTPY